jgi:hypothetical protein
VDNKISYPYWVTKGVFIMNKNKHLWLIIAIISLVGFAASCNVDEPDTGLTGTVSIEPSGDITTGTQLKAVYTGTETDLTYEWKRDNVVLNGYTTPAGSQTQTAGNYTVTVSRESDSKSATVTVGSLTGTISITPSGEVAPNTTLTASYSLGSTGVSYQWKKDGSDVSGATSATYTPTAAGSYTVTITKTGFPNGKTSTAAVTVTDKARFFGTWHNSDNDETVIISANELEYIDADDEGYKIGAPLTWTAITGPTGYSIGFSIKGKLLAKDWIPDQPNNVNPNVGDDCTDHWYISTDGNSLIFGEWISNTVVPNEDPDWIFTKSTTTGLSIKSINNAGMPKGRASRVNR